MDVSFTARFTLPGKRPVSKMNIEVKPLEKVVPQDADLLSLGNRVGGDKRYFDLCALNEIACFLIPAGNVVQNSRPFQGPEN